MSSTAATGRGPEPTTPRELTLSHLCALDASPPELVELASTSGFDGVGALRIVPTLDGRGVAVTPGSRMLRETRQRLADTGASILDVEVLRVTADGPQDAERLLEVGALLGARHLLTMVIDTELDRARDSVAELARLATPFGVVPVVEFMIFSGVRTLADAIDVTSAAPADHVGILVDSLHLERSAGSPADLAAVPRERLPYLQLNDVARPGPAADEASALEEAVHHRLAPGDGCLPLIRLLEMVPGTPVSVEAPLPDGRSPREWARHLAVRTRTLLDHPSHPTTGVP